MKLFLLFCFAVFFFTGCNKKNQQAEVKGPQSGAGGAAQKQGKVVSEAVAKDISMSLLMVEEMARVYQEITPIVAGTEVKKDPNGTESATADKDVVVPKGVLYRIAALIRQEYTSEGQGKAPGDPAKEKAKPCTTGKANLVWTDKKDGDRSYREFVLNYNLCQEPKTSYRLASWSQDKNGDWMFAFSIKDFNEAFKAYGSLGAGLRNQKSGCAVRFNEKEKLIDLFDCRVLALDAKGANDVEATKWLYLGQMDFNRTRDVQLKVDGFLMDLTTVPNKKYKLKTTDIPKVNLTNVSLTPEDDPQLSPRADTTAEPALQEQATAQSNQPGSADNSNAQPGSSDPQGQQPGSQVAAPGQQGDGQSHGQQQQPGDSSGNQQQPGAAPSNHSQQGDSNRPRQQQPGDSDDNQQQVQPQAANPPPQAVT